MRGITWKLAALVGIVMLGAGAARAEVLITEGGKPRARIVVADAPTEQALNGARALSAILDRISGAALPIVHESEPGDGPRILVGRSKAVDALGIEVPTGHTPEMKEETILIKSVGTDLVLLGNEDWNYHGTLFAVYDFLEQDLGCRWFFPGAYGEVLPASPTVRVGAIDRVEHPSFRIRDIWYSGWMPVSETDRTEFIEWYERNKLSKLDLSLPGDGTIMALAPADQYFDAHPEIYAVDEKGNRMRDMMCMTEPEGVRIAAETIKKAFRDDPEMLTFGFAPPDGHPMCYCKNCQSFFPGFVGKGYGDPSLSDLWFHFANGVAKEVYKEFPKRWVLTNGYANRVRPPESTGPLSPNLGIQSAMLGTCNIHRTGDPRCWQRTLYQQVLERWTHDLDPIIIYDYDPGKAVDNLPFPALHCLKHDLPWFRDKGVWGFWTEGNNAWMVTYLNYYIRARLMWDADADVDALVREFCQQFYGAAADSVEQYIWTLEDAVEATTTHERWGELMQWSLILPPVAEKLNALMAEAEKAAATSPYQERVHVLRLTHDHMMAYLAMEDAAVDGDYGAAVKQAERMLELRTKAAEIKTGLIPISTDIAAAESSSAETYLKIYQGLLNRTNGTEGNLVAMLPRQWEFKADPEDIGTLYQWYLPGTESGWKPIDVTRSWEAQGYQDEKGWNLWGKAWYRTEFDVPAAPTGTPYRLTFGGIYNTAVWVWVNGVLRPFQPETPTRSGAPKSKYPFDVDVSDLIRPGEKNHVAVLVDLEMPGRSVRGGLHRRVFLWSPK